MPVTIDYEAQSYCSSANHMMRNAITKATYSKPGITSIPVKGSNPKAALFCKHWSFKEN